MTTATVTRAIIARSRRRSCWSCVVALALHETPGYGGAIVSRDDEGRVWALVGSERIELPEEARRLADAYDNGREPWETTFEVPTRAEAPARP